MVLSSFQAFLYDGKSGDKKGELGNPAHKGGIYGVSIKNGWIVLSVICRMSTCLEILEMFCDVVF